MLRKLDERKLRLKPSKYEFHKKELEYLRFLVRKKGIRMTLDKIKNITEWPTLRNIKKVISFFGKTNFNRIFIEEYSKKSELLTDLTRQDTKFTWTSKEEEAFQSLKKTCTTAPVLRIYDPDLAVRLETDASKRALRAALTQEYKKKQHPVAYYSRKFSDIERRYDVHDRELLAIVDSLKH